MLNQRFTKIKRAENVSEQKQDDLQNPRTSTKIWKKITLLDMYICIYICICICMIRICIHIYLYYIYIYAYIFTLFPYMYLYMYIYIHINICVYKIYVYVIICVTIYFTHAIHDQVFNFPYRSLSSLWFVVNKILIEYKAAENFEKYKNFWSKLK